MIKRRTLLMYIWRSFWNPRIGSKTYGSTERSMTICCDKRHYSLSYVTWDIDPEPE